MRTKALVVAAVAAALLALAPGVAAARTRTVVVGSANAAGAPAQFSANAFLPGTVTVRVGDTVRWQFRNFHTVTVPRRGRRPPAFTVPSGFTVTNQLDAAGQPFWFNNLLPLLQPNPQVAAPTTGRTYDGRAFRNSGLPALPNPKPFSLRFTRRGVFTYYCSVHPGMRGRVRVRGRGRIPSQTRVTAAGNRQLAGLVTTAQQTAALPAPGANVVSVGRAPLGQRFTIDAFFPSAISVAAGRPVTFTMAGQNTTEIHTVTLGPVTRTDVPFITPANTVNPIAAYPSDPPPPPPYTGTNHGNGFLNAGLLDANAATPPSALPGSTTITFSTPGTFQLKCLVHDGMDATVTVTP